MKITTAILLMIFSMPSIACRPSLNEIRWAIEDASNVYFGRVTGIRSVSFENSLKEDGRGVITIPGDYKMRVFVTKTLKGKPEEVLEANSTLCKEYYEIHEKVYIFSDAESKNIFAMAEDDFKGNYEDLYEKFSNQALKKDAKNKSRTF